MAATKRKRHVRRPTANEVAPVSYLFEIESIEPHYSFGDAHDSLSDAPYREYHHTELDALCLRPKNCGNRRTHFTLVAARSIDEEMKRPAGAIPHGRGVGTLTFRGDQSHYRGSLPFDVALVFPGMVLSGGYRFILMSGPPMRYGSSRINWFGFYRDLNAGDF